jgi:hypothetical protein
MTPISARAARARQAGVHARGGASVVGSPGGSHEADRRRTESLGARRRGHHGSGAREERTAGTIQVVERVRQGRIGCARWRSSSTPEHAS